MVLMKKNKQSDEVEVDAQKTLSADVDVFVKKWRVAAAQALIDCNYKEYNALKNTTSTLLEWRRQMRGAYEDFLGNKSDSTGYTDVKNNIVKLIEAAKQQNESFSVPRTADGENASVSNCSVPQLHSLHVDMRSRMLDSSKLPESAVEQYEREVEKGLHKRALMEGRLHIFVHMKAAIFSAGEGCQLLFTLWNKKNKEFVSDEFMVALTAAGMPDDISLMEKLYTLFVDLTKSDFEMGLVLVCRIYRIGKLTSEDKASSNSGMMAMGNAAAPISDDRQIYKRHFGTSCLNLTELAVHKLLIGEELTPENIPIYQPKNANENNFSGIHEAIAENRKEEFEVVPKTNGIALGISLYEGDIEAAKEKDAKLQGIENTLRRAMAGVIDDGGNRNDLYVTLTGGDFSQDSKKSAKNIEVKITCMMDSGQPVECLLRGNGPQGMPSETYRSTVYYHTNSPPFHETVKLIIPDGEKFERCHLLFTFYHCSGSKPRAPFGFSFLELADRKNGAALKDGECVLPSYKMLDSMTKGSMIVPKYLQPNAKLTVRNFRTGLSKQDEVLRVKTTMCSTKKTQNGVLHDLINWKSLEPNDLSLVLESCLGKTPGVNSLTHDEIFKFLREIMDALCAIFVEKRANMKGMLPVFHLFAYVLEHFSKRHFKSYASILETYIRDYFQNSKMHKVLLQCVDYYMKWIEDEDAVKQNPKEITVFLNFMSSFNYIIWIINVSRSQDPTADKSVMEFKGALLDLMTRVNRLMQLEKPERVKVVRGKTLNHFPSVIDHLLQIFSPSEVSVIAAGFLDVVPLSNQKGSFNKDKLALIQHICEGAVFKDNKARGEVLAAILKTLMEFLADEDIQQMSEREMAARHPDQDTCIRIVLKMLEVIQEEDDKVSVNSIVELLPCLISFVNRKITRNKADKLRNEASDHFNPTLSDGATAILTLLYLMDDTQYSLYLSLDEGATGAGKKQKLLSVLRCLRSLMQNKESLYPHVWLVFHVFQSEVTVKLLEWTNSYMMEDYVSEAKDDISEPRKDSLWEIMYDVGMDLIVDDMLEMESSQNTTRDGLLMNNAYNVDLRLCVETLLRQNWETLGDECRILLADDLVQKLLAQVGSKCDEVSAMCKAFFFDLLKGEYVLTKDFRKVRNHTISSVGAIVTVEMAQHIKEGKETNPLLSLFTEDLAVRFRADNVLNCEDGTRFLAEIKKLFELLLALAQFPKNASHEQERSFAYSQLMEYLKKMHRLDSYKKYAHSMASEMLGLGLYIEAGKALLLHANLIDWNDEGLEEFENNDGEVIFKPQLCLDRKQELYRMAMLHFDKAQYWEGSLHLCEHLREFYANGLFDFEKVSSELDRMSSYYTKIRNTDRFYPSTFRVGFYGGFSLEFKNTDYVYRGDVLESIGDFTTRIKKKFPSAEMLGVKVDADKTHKENSEAKQYIQISKVTPVPGVQEGAPGGWKVARVPRYARDFNENNEVTEYWYSRPFRKRQVKSANEFLDLWIEKKILSVKEKLPSTQRRSRVEKVDIEIVNPLENAVTEIEKKNAELKEKFAAMRNLPDGGADNSYTMALNGVVDAAVNGGIGNYETFINGKYKVENAEIYEDVKSSPLKATAPSRLLACLREQLLILEAGVVIHATKCSPSLLPLHEHIDTMFAKMKVETNLMMEKAAVE
ncbi:hypothetical protein TL16_g04668 [Triparma laevis f. inornata]|nr:hypothetical protein TL16_g04668 [Triparma laevis f. inornata]